MNSQNFLEQTEKATFSTFTWTQTQGSFKKLPDKQNTGGKQTNKKTNNLLFVSRDPRVYHIIVRYRANWDKNVVS